MFRRFMLGSMVLAAMLMVFGSLLAQSNETIITIGLEGWQQDLISDRVLQGFYETHPGVKVVPVLFNGDEAYTPYDPTDAAGSLAKAQTFFGRADILPVNDYNFDPIYTRAGFVMDMTPLINSDSSGAIEDYEPVALKIFSWDNGIWGLPLSMRLQFMAYDEKAFDNAGYPHPDSSWMLDDYLDAARALTVRDDSGKVTQPAFYGYDELALMRAFLGHGFYDSSTGAELAALNTPDVEAMVAAFDAFKKDTVGDDPDTAAMQTWDWSKFALQTGGLWMVSDDRGGNPYVPVALPGDAAIISGEGYAISAGTLNPELAYEFITYLSGNIEVTANFYGEIPVRHSLDGQTFGDIEPAKVSDSLAPLLPTLLENAIPTSELRYGDYIALARSMMADDENMTLHEALTQAQEQAVTDYKLADGYTTTQVVVSTPVPTPVLSGSEYALKFSLQASFSSNPNQDLWDRVTQEFVDSDPEVGYIEYVPGYRDPSEQFKQIDCAYLAWNYLPTIDRSLLLPLDPALASDSAFDRSDTPDMLWNAVTQDNQVYILPMTMRPIMMWYKPDDFEAAGVEAPRMGWMVSEFLMTLQMLKDAQPDKKPYHSQNYGTAPYVLLAASLGGVAVDYTTYVPTYHLTDPAVVEALRQTMDMAVDGLIDYTELEGDGGGTKMIFVGADASDNRPTMYDAPAYVDDWSKVGTEDNPYLPVTFPSGADIIPLSFEVGGGYITSATQHPEACYRWLSTLAQHPELFTDMPARRSQAANPALIAAQGQSASDFYVGMFGLIDSPQATFVPAGSSTNNATGAYIADIWFGQALDAYVKDGADLEKGLADAQAHIDDYSLCISGIEPMQYTPGNDDAWNAYYKQFTDCAVAVDPSLAPRFEQQSGG